MITTTQRIVTSAGSVEARLLETGGLGLPHSSRSDAVSVLVGFHSATGWSHDGSVDVATKTFEMKVMGNRTVKPTCWATSTVGTDSPSQTPSHAIAKANSRSKREPRHQGRNAVVDRQPTASR